MIHLNEIPTEATPVFKQLLDDQNPDALWEEWQPASTRDFIDEIFHVPDEEEGDPQPEDIERAEEPVVTDAAQGGELVYFEQGRTVDADEVEVPTAQLSTVVRSLRDKYSA